ncbi:MAG: PKD domain-containing protein [Candidatus Aenigmarchaeota archaeon]|nr:PKD domain-containing protein [Candidatus Aenigmarchaeota archaeon]
MERRIYLLYFGLAVIGLLFAGYLALFEPTGYIAANYPPYAAFSYSPSEPFETEEITFDASESYDSDGSIISYEWDFGDGSRGEDVLIGHSYDFPGEYAAKLVVEDGKGKKNSISMTVKVSGVYPKLYNERPVPILEMPDEGAVNEEITLDADRSYDRDGRIIKFRWDLGDGRQAEGRTVKATYSRPGEYAVWLTVKDDNGARNSVGKIITIS